MANQSARRPATALLTTWLIALQRQRARGPLGTQALEQHLRQCIVKGELAAGARLPTSRALALAIAVGRNIVKDAYARLTHEGLLSTRGREGTFVTGVSVPPRKPAATTRPRLRERLRTPIEARPARAPFDWRLGRAHTASLPAAVWRAACREAARHPPPTDHGDPRGDAALRQALSTWLRAHRALHARPEQIVITAGAGQAIDLLARVLIRPRDPCAIEDPGYPRAAAAFARQGARLVSVEVDREGARVERLLQAREPPVLIHLTAAHQYPLGGRLSTERRHALIDQAMKHGTLILENEYDHEFVHEGQRFAPLAATAPEHVALVGTFARAISPALRLGYVVAPDDVATAIARLIEQEQLQASWPVQQSARWLLTSGELDRHLRRVGKHYAHLREQLETALQPLAPHLEPRGLQGGLHAVLDGEGLKPARFERFRQRLLAAGAVFDPIERFCIHQHAPRVILLGYAQLSPRQVTEATRLIANALQQALA